MGTIHDPRQIPLIVPETTWRPSMETFSLQGRKRVCVDVETKDEGLAQKMGAGWAMPKMGYICGITVATDELSRYYPLAHPEGNVENPDMIRAWLRDELARYEGTIVGMKLDYDLGWMAREGIAAPLAKTYDVQAAEAVIDPEREGFSLNAIAKTYGLEEKDERLIHETAAAFGLKAKNARANLFLFPGHLVGAYGERDGALPLEIMDRQLPIISQLGLQRVNDVEQQVVRLVMEMRWRGARVDLRRAAQTREKLIQLQREQMVEIKRISGRDVELWENNSVAMAFLALDLDFPTSMNHAPSFQAQWLDAHPHPLAKAIRQARKYNKAWSTFIDKMIGKHVDENGYIHPEWHALPSENDDGDREGVPAGRFSCARPNLQQVPARDLEIGPMIRSLFIPEEGEFWFTSDISQQEPRFTVHYAYLRKFTGSADAVRRIRENPRIDYHQMVADITNLPRKSAKTINLGVAYGMGGAKLCRDLGLPTAMWHPNDAPDHVEIPVAGDEGRKILDQYHSSFPFIRELARECSELAAGRGWIRTYLGRYCRFDLWEPTKRSWDVFQPGLTLDKARREYGNELKRAYTHKAMNRLIQGSSADMIKLAMVKMYKDLGHVPVLTIHDEIDTSCCDDETALEIDRCIRESVNISVPIVTDMERGPSWGETEKWQ